MAKKFLILLLFFPSWAGATLLAFSHDEFFESSYEADEALAWEFKQISFSSYFLFNGYLLDATGNSIGGHSCLLSSAAFVFTPDAVPADVNSIYRYNYWYCADGYMGPGPTLLGVATGYVVFFILGLVGLGAWLLFRP